MKRKNKHFLNTTRHRMASALIMTMAVTTIAPSYAWAASENIDRYSWYIPDEDRLLEDIDDVASPGDASPSDATPSDAAGLISAVRSFNASFTFVDQDGKEIPQGDPLNIPETENSFPYLSQTRERTKGGIDLEDYGYVENEYFISGNANIYKDKDGDLATSSDAEYVNRLIVFQPEDPGDFQGQVYVEILNASSGVDLPDIWRRSYDYFMRTGSIYIGVTSKEGNVNSLKKFDPDRYDALKWTSNGIIWDILGQIGSTVKQEASPLLYGTELDQDISCYLIGQSQSGFYTNTFVNYFDDVNYLADPEEVQTKEDVEQLWENGTPIFDGILNVVGGGASVPLVHDGTSGSSRKKIEPSRVPFILVVGENDYNPSIVREDSDEPGEDMYRHYVFTGGAHSCKVFLPDMIDEIQVRAGRPAGEYLPFKVDPNTGRPHTNTDLNMDVFVNGALQNLHEWASGEEEAPHGPAPEDIDGEVSGSRFVPMRDEYGNMTGGIKSPQIEVPVAAYYGGANGAFSTDGGSMVYFDDETLSELYTDRDDYLTQYEEALDKVIEEGWILEEDRDLMMQLAENEPIFGNPGKDDEIINETMAYPLNFEELSSEVKSAGSTSYTDTELLIEGEANVYGIMRGNTLYRRRLYSMPYTNYARVCIPDNFRGTVVIDLVLSGEEGESKDVSGYMRGGRAYVALTADPEAAASKGGNWEILNHNKSEVQGNPPILTRPEVGLRWDIISQMAAAISRELPRNSSEPIRVILGKDENECDIAYTYEQLFQNFESYAVSSVKPSDNPKMVALNSLDVAFGNEEEPDTPSKPGSGGGSGTDSSSGSSSTSGSAGAVSGTTLTGQPVSGSWSLGSNNKWTFRLSDGTLASSCWLSLSWNGSSDWYYFLADGTMAEGWLVLDGQTYYMHPTADGTRGHMYTGWHQIDGKWYYFHNISDGSKGHMLVNTTTPDNYQVGADGARIQ